MPKLSIIVPVYNVEKYLPTCIESILNQTFLDYELILIDDGSPDRCGKICDEYVQKDNRIQVLHQENAGVSAARNAGMKIAKGELLSFVDADDFLHPQMYEMMITAMAESGSDIGVCEFRFVKEDESYEFAESAQLSYQKLSAEEYISRLYSIPPTFYNSCCNKIFSRSCISEMFDTNLVICEDAKFLVQNVKADNVICYVPCKFYYVLARGGSATRGKAAFFLQEPSIRKEICEIIKKDFWEIYPTAYRFYVDRCFNVLYMQTRKSNDAKKAKKYLTQAVWELKKIKGIPAKERLIILYAFFRAVICQ